MVSKSFHHRGHRETQRKSLNRGGRREKLRGDRGAELIEKEP